MFFCQSKAAQTQKESALDQVKLEKILANTKEYCRRLENAAIDFVCVEAVSEIIDNSKELLNQETFLVIEAVPKASSLGFPPKKTAPLIDIR